MGGPLSGMGQVHWGSPAATAQGRLPTSPPGQSHGTKVKASQL